MALNKHTQDPAKLNKGDAGICLLTDNAKVDFEAWLILQKVAPYKVMFWDIPKIVQCAYITQWLDLMQIYTEIIIIGYNFTFKITDDVIHTTFEPYEKGKPDWLWGSRPGATLKAIETANEMFNKRNKD